MAARDQFMHAGGRQAHPEFIVFDFFWYAYQHVCLQVKPTKNVSKNKTPRRRF
jgi:hypothetical protein